MQGNWNRDKMKVEMPAYHSILYLLGLCSDTVFSRNSNSKCPFSFPELCFSYLHSDIYYAFFPVSRTFVWLLCFHFLEVQHLIAYMLLLVLNKFFFNFMSLFVFVWRYFLSSLYLFVIYSLFRNELFLPYLFGFLRFCCYSLLVLLC